MPRPRLMGRLTTQYSRSTREMGVLCRWVAGDLTLRPPRSVRRRRKSQPQLLPSGKGPDRRVRERSTPPLPGGMRTSCSACRMGPVIRSSVSRDTAPGSWARWMWTTLFARQTTSWRSLSRAIFCPHSSIIEAAQSASLRVTLMVATGRTWGARFDPPSTQASWTTPCPTACHRHCPAQCPCRRCAMCRVVVVVMTSRRVALALRGHMTRPRPRSRAAT
mmetsp:Transcript_22877/g.73654  ORF Transcript_22877/g.73654 Transcript_22877/m.73654 type:complete len:219 (-) Transcript_22877:562-1218(-)